MLALLSSGLFAQITSYPLPSGGGGGTGCIPAGSAGQVITDDGAGACTSNSTAAGVLTFLGTPTSTNLAALLTNETGSSLAVFNTSPLLVTPKVTTITDANGNPFIISSATASAVDSLTVTNAATANPATVTISATGSDTNINLSLAGKGSGIVQLPGGTQFGSGSGVAGGWQCTQGTTSTPAANTILVQCPTSVSTAYTITMPGAAANGIRRWANSSNVVAESVSEFSGDITTSGSNVATIANDAVTTVKILNANVTAAKLVNAGVFTGDVITTFPAVTVAKVNGIAYSAIAAAHSVEVITTANTTATAKTLPDCGDTAGNHINFTQSTDAFSCGTSASGGGAAGATLFSTTNSTAVTATSATTLIGTVTGSTTVAVNTFTAGQLLQIHAHGFYSTPATPASLTIDLKIGGTTRISTGAVVQIASVTNGVWNMDCDVTTRTAGASGTQIANCIFVGTGSTLTPGEAPMFVSSAWTIDTTATEALDLQATWSTATGSPTITSTNIAAWIPGAPVTSVFGQTGVVVAPVALGSSTATTQARNDNSTNVANTAYVDRPTNLPAAGTSATLAAPREYFICSSTCTVTPPVPAAGMEFCVMNGDNVATVITMAAIGTSARYENTARTAYGTAGTGTFVSAGAAGDKVCIVGLDSTHYITTAFNGTWTAN